MDEFSRLLRMHFAVRLDTRELLTVFKKVLRCGCMTALVTSTAWVARHWMVGCTVIRRCDSLNVAFFSM